MLKALPLVKFIFGCSKDRFSFYEFNALENYLGNLFKDKIVFYNNKYEEAEECNIPKVIWTCWWQGEDNMPEIVKCCYKSLLNNRGDNKVVLITKDNYTRYLNLPRHILELYKNKTIEFAFVSDVMRAGLLRKYGGLWIDITYLVTAPITINASRFYTIRAGKDDFLVPRGRWSGNCIGGFASYKLFAFLYDCLVDYWINNKYLVDYFLIDHIINLAYDNFPDVKKDIDNIKFIFPNLINFNLNGEYTHDTNILLCRNKFIKLSWKKEYKDYLDNGKKTNYNYIINNY